MILLIEPISKNIDLYVPAYPLPLMEIASYTKRKVPQVEMRIISISMDYGLPLSREGKERIYEKLIHDVSDMQPKGVGISCTAIAQAEETIYLCARLKEYDPGLYIFLGGYFPTIYHEELFDRTSNIDFIIIGEGEIPSQRIMECITNNRDPKDENIFNLAWKENGRIHYTEQNVRFDLNHKEPFDLGLLRYPKAYDVLPYSFSRGCPYQCHFCMEDHIRPIRKKVPDDIVKRDLFHLCEQSDSRTLMVSDALFKSFDLFPLLREMGMKVNFETRCDVLDPSFISEISDVCGILAIGFESASYNTLKRMNKVVDRNHYKKYISNAMEIFKQTVNYEIPIVLFIIIGYPGDTEEDLKETLAFTHELSKNKGAGGFIFKVGECWAYPKTKTYDLALSMPGVSFDNDGVFGQNVIRKPSENLDFEMILKYMRDIYHLSHHTPKLRDTILKMMPFFRLPSNALKDEMIPETCFIGNNKDIFNVQRESIQAFRRIAPDLMTKYRAWMPAQRSARNLPF